MNKILHQATLLLTTFFICLSAPNAEASLTSFVPTGAVWKYLDNGSNQGTAWRDPSFNDSAWSSGPAQLGYGDGDEATVVSYGPDASNKYVTTYFRRAFNVSDAASYSSLTLRVLRDDGVVVYLNGTEVFRQNMPSGTITYTTFASAAVGGGDESAFYTATPNPALLVEGTNVLAVEIHQVNASSSDVSFDLELTGVRQLIYITLNAPANGAVNQSLSPTLDVSVSHRDGLPTTVTFQGRVAPSVGADFTLIALPDTQFYSSGLNGGTPEMFVAQTEWILANRQSRNIVFTTLLGDCVQNGDTYESEWWNATNALYRLEDPLRTSLTYGIPYAVAVGNHDQSPVGSATGTTTFYNQYFGEAHFAGKPYYGGHYGSNNDEHFEFFSAAGINFIIIHLEWDSAMTTSSPELAWANNLLQTYSSYQAIVVSHYIIGTGNPGAFGAQGQAIYSALKGNPNLFMMLCGHVCDEGRRTDVFNGQTVYTLLSDYQCRPNGGNGLLRILEFSPANSVIRVRTYSPTLDQYETDANSQFDLYYDMQSLVGSPFSTIAVNSSVPSGSSTSTAWANRTTSTEYEWFVTVSDGTETVTSPAWRFRTVDQDLPSSPSGLTATAQSTSAILLTWTDNANNESGFEVYQSLDGVNFSAIGTVDANVTSAPVSGLQPNTTYYYRVRAFNGTGYSADSNVANATTFSLPPPPSAPFGLAAAVVSDSQLNLTWTDTANNEDGFAIERSIDGLNFIQVATVAPNTTIYSDSGLASLTTYYYRVRAYNGGGTSEYSNVASAATSPPPPPAAPTGLAAVAGDRNVTLTWDKSAGASHYRVYRSEFSGGGYTQVAYGVFETTWIDSGVAPHTTYFYVVTAANDGGESSFSNEASATPYALPAAPTGAAIAWTEVQALEISWTDNATDETGYRIERSLDDSTFLVITNLPADTAYHRDEPLLDNTTYYYRIRAFNNDGQSAAAAVSGTTLMRPPDAPADLTATAGDARVTLTWSASARASSYTVKRSQTPADPNPPILDSGVTNTSYVDLTVANGTTYYYVVSAVNAGGEGPNSIEASATPTANRPPTAVADAYTVSEDGVLTIAAPGVLGNDTDAENNPLTAIVVTESSSGALSLSGNGSFIYTPNPNFNGTDNFTYKASDGSNESAPVTVSLTVSPVNDSPAAIGDTATTQQGVGVSIPVLTNDTDADGDTLSVTTVTQPSAGTATINANNTVTYRPNPSFGGQDTFTYTASDGTAASTAIVTVTVNKVIVFSDGFESGSFAAGEWTASSRASVDATAAYTGSYGALLKNTASLTKRVTSVGATTVYLAYVRRTSGLDPGELFIVEVSSDGQSWAAAESVGGTTPWEARKFEVVVSGSDFHFRFRTAGNDGNDVAMIDDVEVTAAGANAAPVVQNDIYSATEDNVLTVAAPGVLGNDSDPEGEPLTAVLLNVPNNGSVSLNANGSFAFTPNANFSGSDSFTYKASDGSKDSPPATATITVMAVNDPPQGNADAYEVARGSTLSVAAPGVLGNDTDADGDALVASLQVAPVSGSLILNADGSFTYTPNATFSGTDTFTYAASDAQGATSTANVTITVNTPPVAPTALTASAVSSSRIDLGWIDNSGDENGFRIERSTDGVNFTEVAVVGANVATYSDTGLAASTPYSYRVRSYNAAGNSPYSNVASATTQVPAAIAVTFISIATHDGFLTESSETSNVGGTATSADNTTAGLRAGDDNKDRQSKSIVSFDTSSIPDGATILSATLRLKRGKVTGTNPFETHGNCFVDIKSATGFNSSLDLTSEDFHAPSSASQVALLSNATADGDWSEGTLNILGLSVIDKAGTTQCRIYFELDDNDNRGTDYIGWYAGDNVTTANRPQLVLVYE